MVLLFKNTIGFIKNIDPDTGVTFEFRIIEDGTAILEVAKIGDYEGDLVIPQQAVGEDGTQYPVRIVGWPTELDEYWIKKYVDDDVFNEWKREYGLKSHQILALNLGYFSPSNNIRSVTFSEGIEAIFGEVFHGGYGSLLTVNLPSTIKYLYCPFRNCINFEDQLGGLIQYNGTENDWKTLANKSAKYIPYHIPYDLAEGIDTDLGMDYTPYRSPDLMINFCKPEDFHIRMEEDYILNSDDNNAHIQIMHPEGDFAVPERYEKEGTQYTITEIGTAAFACNRLIKSVRIPPTIKKIERDAFYSNENLEELTISDSDEPLIIEDGVFSSVLLKNIYRKRHRIQKLQFYRRQYG